MQQLLVKDHNGFFTKLFRLLDPTDNLIEGEIRGSDACMRDAWTEQFVNTYVHLRSPEALAVLTLQAIILKYDIAQIECKHASVRRWVHARSTQTHTVDF